MDLRLSRARLLDLDFGMGHTAYRSASLIDLYLHAEFHLNRTNVLWTNGRMDRHLKPSSLDRLLRVDQKK